MSAAKSKGSAVLFLAALIEKAGGKVTVSESDIRRMMDRNDGLSSHYDQAECLFHLEYVKDKEEFVNEECGRIDPQ